MIQNNFEQIWLLWIKKGSKFFWRQIMKFKIILKGEESAFVPWEVSKKIRVRCRSARRYSRLMSINPILSETTLEFMLGQDEIFVRAKIQREFEYFDELNIIHNERSEFWWCLMSKIFKFKLKFGPKNFVASRHK